MFNFFKNFKNNNVTIVKRSNIIQLDDMGYPLQLCIMSDNSQQWIDINEEYAKKEIGNGHFYLLEWE